MPWKNSLDTFILIFDVGRGSAAFVRTPFNQGMIVDLAGTTDFSPIAFIRSRLLNDLDLYDGRKIAQAVISHPHTDHIRECEELSKPDLYPALITCPHDKSPEEAVDWSRIKNQDGDRSLKHYRMLFEQRRLPLQTIKHNSINRPKQTFEYGIYYLRPPVCATLHKDDNQYGNAMSMVFYLRYGSNSILIPGDITSEAMQKLLDQTEGVEKRFTIFDAETQRYNPDWHQKTGSQPSLKQRLKDYGLSVLIAPHHGLESCYSSELALALRGGKPQINVISEKRQTHENQGCIHHGYQSEQGASGLTVRFPDKLEKRYSITTKSGHILIRFNGSGLPVIRVDPDARQLLND
jgi:beta-lactamase superfamily II metal-dependent hydrolase